MENGVLLINMPFSGADRPQIGISLLKSALRARGVPCDTRYFNLVFADWVGPEVYQWFSGELDHTIFAGEWVFAQQLFGDALIDSEGYFRHIRETHHIPDESVKHILNFRSYVERFLNYCMKSVDWSRYSVVGFTSTFEQNLASLALARLVKQRFPDKIIVMGGANCENPMGVALHRCFPFLDYVFTGEADKSFPEFIERLRQNKPVESVKGMVYRRNGESIYTGHSDPITEMDALPYPDYEDFFEQIEETNVAKHLALMVQVETSRGCWWGAKHHCTFCGLNAVTMSFRAKTQRRALEEILHLTARYPVQQIAAVDNIMDLQYFKELLPELKRRKLKLHLFYEVKANLTKDQVKMLSEAGVTMIQPGIESLHQKMLTLMRKGVTPLQNVQLMKWCKQFGVTPSWNLLYGFPGESPREYEEMLPLIESLFHLPPPDGFGPIRLDRFSPYFMNPASFGLVNARPMKVYRYIYPFPESDLAEIAYFYDYQHGDGLDPTSYINPTLDKLEEWNRLRHDGQATLTMHASGDGLLVINDARPNAVQKQTTLYGWQRDIYEFCDQVRPLSAIRKHVAEWLKGNAADGVAEAEISETQVRDFLNHLVSLRVMARDGEQYLSLAIPAATTTAAKPVIPSLPYAPYANWAAATATTTA